MTQEQIQQLFKQGYNQHHWKQFLSQVFSDARFHATPDELTGINTDVASQVLHLGYVNLNENGIERNIAVYDVTLAPRIVLERNRVGLRNLLRKYWKDIDAAFIVYHRPENPNWRFTYVSELTGFDAKGELIKVKTEPKRYTYILGEGESCRTAAERFAIVAKKGNKTSLDDVKDAFSVEKLSKSFFDEYKKHYELFCDYMVSKPNIRQTIFNGDEKAIRDFNKKLLGRIVFLYFIQKKGWLGVPENSDWGQGDPDFLWNLFNNARNKGLFYSEYLTRLFFDTLNTPRPNDLIELKKGELIKIPFLNGGLFEEDNKNYRNLIFPAELFENLFLFFNQYNFTIYEDDPNDHIVAVDPEMLGHIFENLLEDNKDKGAFYTPKEIVHYMCQESLIEYLCTTLKIEDEAKEKEAVTALLKQKEIDEILKPELKNINDALDKVKICDPAIGSGAFPMGLLKEIFTAKQTLYTFENGNTEGFDASGVKLNIIQNSIYGVDIEKGAVDIARLRFWLSLVVDEESPKALPNLDYKIVVGNSLISKLGDDIIDIDWNLNETSHGLFGAELAIQKAELLKKIGKEQKEFFNPKSEKKKLAADIRKLKIDLLINQLELMVKTEGIETRPTGNGKAITKQTERYLETLGWEQQIEKLKTLKDQPEKPLNFFDWKLDFPEVLNELINPNTGFDIVIGNPPYGFRTVLSKDEKDYFRKVRKIAFSSGDSAELFVKISFDNLIKERGVQTFIIPKKSLYGDAWEDTRINYWKKYNLIFILDTGKSFENVLLEASVFCLKKEKTKNDIKVAFLTKNGINEVGSFPINELLAESNTLQVYKAQYPKSIIEKIDKIKFKEKIVEGKLGLAIGTDFFSETETNDKLLKGIDIQRYQVRSHRYLKNKQKLKKESYEEFLKPKVLVQRLVAHIENPYPHLKITACYDNDGIIITNTLMSFSIDDRLSEKFWLAYLNSKFVSWYAYNFIYARAIRGMDFYNFYIQQVPIPNISKEYQKIFIGLVDQILIQKSQNQDTSFLEQQIDNLVYKLYDLTEEEIAIIEGGSNGK